MMENENNVTYIKCTGCKCLRNEKDEFEIYKGTRRKTCNICKEFRVKYKCEHGREKSSCIECGGSGICIHKKRKTQCKKCGGCSICIHNKQKSICKECGGSSICIHNKQKSKCIVCGGNQICIHDKQKSQCKECSPQLVTIKLVRSQVYRTFKNLNLKKINHSIDYLGCDTETLKEHFKKKMTDDMTFENIHIDHIKPVSRFNIEDEEEILKCCHFTNLQPLLCKDNLELNNKWTEENELFWNEHIIYKPEFDKLYKI